MIDRRVLTLPRASAALAVTTMAVLAVAMVNTDGLVERGFASAMSRTTAAATVRTAQDGISGSEDFWLHGTRLPNTAPASWSKPPAVEGERITIAAGGREIVLEVVDVRPLPAGQDIQPAVTRLDTGEPAAQIVIVTCREVGASADARPIRFVVEPNAALPWRALGAPARAL